MNAEDSEADKEYDYDRYLKILAEATDEPKRWALINLLIEENAKAKLLRAALRTRLAGMGLSPTTEPED